MFHMFPVNRRYVCFLCHLWNRTDLPWLWVLLWLSQGEHHPVLSRMSNLFCWKAIGINKYDKFYLLWVFFLFEKEWILYHSKLCILCLHLLASQHGKSMHNNTVCKFHYRRDLMISVIRCGGRMYTYWYWYWLSAKWVANYQHIGYQSKIQYCASLIMFNVLPRWAKLSSTDCKDLRFLIYQSPLKVQLLIFIYSGVIVVSRQQCIDTTLLKTQGKTKIIIWHGTWTRGKSCQYS